MASQSILTGIRRLWEYMTVPSYGNIPLDIEEEHDPVGEFLERQSRGDVQNEVVDDADVSPEKKPKAKTAKSSPINKTDASLPSTEVRAAGSGAGLKGLESEAPLDSPPVETESEVPQDVIDSEEEGVEGEVMLPVADTNPEEGESEVSKMAVEEELQAEEQIKGEQKEEGKEEEAQQGGNDDMLDIFRTEKEVKEKDIIQDTLIDIDVHDLLEESRELIAEINTRRYGKKA